MSWRLFDFCLSSSSASSPHNQSMLLDTSCEESAHAGNTQVTVESVEVKMGVDEEQCHTDMATSVHDSAHQGVKALERAHEIIAGLGRHETPQSGHARGGSSSSSHRKSKALLDVASPTGNRFDRLYADGAERAERLAVAQAQKRMDELLEGPGSATGKINREMKKGDKSPNSTASGPCPKNRFERLYAEGAESVARRKDLEESVIREEDEKLRMEIAKAKKTRLNGRLEVDVKF
ncbi:hypothetical protein FOL47_007628 [Perkinsus chesapeaki]|uniref:Uncharacterized protein n=1 Tax=Perkinsus chesapeaki TaxID=330153 RepID=A0A7J6LJ55_PERCH|nr:hypothetical protein FOL47_007628 [Perkinsus chesapeaki]